MSVGITQLHFNIADFSGIVSFQWDSQNQKWQFWHYCVAKSFCKTLTTKENEDNCVILLRSFM